jgi:rsbT co-antagonist protein RsbR
MDTQRSVQLMSALLTSVQRHSARVVIIDITGVPTVDADVAGHLLRAARAVGLLGARCVLAGVSPRIAQTLVGLGVDLGGLTTLRDLQAAVAQALAARPRATR